ncbi:hypothetical protein DL767_008843 [Monosporascus sp. MG133]|nr:hypothetical protein DL767_008843 [Monosporascus sp. MG133]
MVDIERKLIRKLDWVLLPWLCVLYLLAFLDRTNIGNAKIADLGHDTNLMGDQFEISLSIFFIPYSLCIEPLTNVLLKKWRPSLFIPTIMILWGASMAAGSFGGLLAAGIERMYGTANLRGWQWIFVLEGLLTIVFGVASFWMVYDFPDKAGFLSDDDRARVMRRLKLDQQSSVDREEWKTEYLVTALKYAGTFLGAAGIYPCISNTITWMANNIEGVYKRGVVLGFVIGWGNLNGIVSFNIYRNGPSYLEGHGVVMAYLIVFLFGGSLLMTTLLRAENKRRRAGERDYLLEGKGQQEIAVLGDKRPDSITRSRNVF